MHHSTRKILGIALAGKVETIYIFGVAPLMERSRSLIVFETLQNGTVDDHLMILQLASHHTECVVLLMMVDLHLAQSRRAARWHPLLLVVIVHHHRGACANNALLTANKNGKVKETYTKLVHCDSNYNSNWEAYKDAGLT